VIVAMVAVRVMQVVGDPVIHRIAVRYRLMAAPGTMHVARCMPGASMVRRAAVRVFARYVDHVLVDMVLVRVMKMAVMQVIDMAAVPHGWMSAAGAVPVSMVGVGLRRACRHLVSSFPCPGSAGTPERLSAAWSIALRINSSTCSSARE